jgi:hypothetical protein
MLETTRDQSEHTWVKFVMNLDLSPFNHFILATQWYLFPIEMNNHEKTLNIHTHICEINEAMKALLGIKYVNHQ